MAKINLLPWRAERRQVRQREFYGMLGLSAVLGIALSIALYAYYSGLISGQESRNAYLQTNIDEVLLQNKEIEGLDKQKSQLLGRKNVIEELQSSRSQTVRLFETLVRTIPEGVTLTSLKQTGDELTLDGRAQSNPRVGVYMTNIERSGWMAKPELRYIEDDPRGSNAGDSVLPYKFRLMVKLMSIAEQEAAAKAGNNDYPLETEQVATITTEIDPSMDMDAAELAPLSLSPDTDDMASFSTEGNSAAEQQEPAQ